MDWRKEPKSIHLSSVYFGEGRGQVVLYKLEHRSDQM